MNLGIFSGCLPILSPLIRRMRENGYFELSSRLTRLRRFSTAKPQHNHFPRIERSSSAVGSEQRSKFTYRSIIERVGLSHSSEAKLQDTSALSDKLDKSLPSLPESVKRPQGKAPVGSISRSDVSIDMESGPVSSISDDDWRRDGRLSS